MDLRYEQKLTFSGCYVCGHAGNILVIWPQQPIERPEPVRGGRDASTYSDYQQPIVSWLPGKWEVYITSHTLDLRSGKKRIEACLEHYNLLGANWIEIAQSEVDLENAWHRYIERMER